MRFVVLLALASCGGRTALVSDPYGPPEPAEAEGPYVDAASTACGPGTTLAQGQCVADSGAAPSEARCVGLDPAHDNAQPNDRVASPLMPRWTANAGGRALTPLIAQGLVFFVAVGNEDTLTALDLATGKARWRHMVSAGAVGVAYDGGKVLALAWNGSLEAFDAASGRALWSTTLAGDAFAAAPVATKGLVYVNATTSSGGTTYAVDEQTAATTWTGFTNGDSRQAVAVSGGLAFVADGCDDVVAFDAQHGALRWHDEDHCSPPERPEPSVIPDALWINTALTGAVIYDLAGHVTRSFPGTCTAFFGKLAICPGPDGLAAAVAADPAISQWILRGDGFVSAPVVVAGGGAQVFAASSSGTVYEVGLAGGIVASSASVGSDPPTAMVLAANTLIVTTETMLVAF